MLTPAMFRNLLRRMPAPLQFTESIGDMDEMRTAAWAHLRLADSQYLPLERTRLVALLAKWGAFPHLQGGACRACQGPAPSATSPFLMLPGAQPAHEHGHSGDGGEEGEEEGRTYASGGHTQ